MLWNKGGRFLEGAGKGAGNFQSQQRFLTGNRPVAMTVVDVNGDGKPDIITANRNSNTVSVILHR